MDPDTFPAVTIASVNCNSLNMSSVGSFNHKLKLYGITSLKSDIILVPDIRLSNNANVSCIDSVKTTFRTNPYGGYDFFYNSTQNKRGVGILLKKSACFSVLEEKRDVNENILLLRVTKEGNAREFYICAIYGPNRYEPAFFQDLRTLLADSGNIPVIIAGYWNCTVSNSVAAVNPDIINMNSLPNKRHSDLLTSLCDDLELHDPFRTRYSNVIDYTYIPTDVTKKNRSRIDFFIISKSLSTKVTECCIKKNLQNKLFDHKAISLSFVKKNGNVKIPVISKSILKDRETDLIVGLAVADCYLLYSAEFNEDELQRLRRGLGLAWQQLREAGPGNYYAAPGDRTEHKGSNYC